MFLHMSIILPTRGVSGRHPPRQTPPWADNPWADTPSWADIPRADTPRQTSPWADHPQQTATAADGTHPTGMHSCIQ